jgi:hypothetical protein
MEKRYRVTLMAEERQELQKMVSTGKAATRKLMRARVLLLADQAESGPGKTTCKGANFSPCPRRLLQTAKELRKKNRLHGW